MATRQQIITSARSYLNVPWHHLGRTRAGMDCVGLLLCVARDCSLEGKDQREYTRGPQPTNFTNTIFSQTDEAPSERWRFKSGQIAIFRQSVYPMHVGIICVSETFGTTIIHAAANCRKVVEQPFSYLEKEFVGAREYRGVED